MFGSPKLEVLESKLAIYEDLSREMLTKLETAVEKISEGNNRIAQILSKHEERIDQNIRNDELILNMFADLKTESNQFRINVEKKISDVEKKVEDNLKTKWLVMGMGILLVFVINIGEIIYPIWSNNIQHNQILKK